DNSFPRRSRAPVLAVVLTFLIVGGGAAGFYAWSARVPPNNEQGQKTVMKEQIASRGSTELSGTGKERQPPGLNAPPAPESSLPTFREDFTKTTEGELPKGWEGTAAVSVRKGGDRPHLTVTDPGQHDVTLPAFPLPKNFFVECNFRLGLGPHLELTLEGRDGGRNLVLEANASSGRSTGVAALLAVGLADLDAKENTKAADPEGQFRLRLERDGEVFRVKVNGETVHARPVRGYQGFARVR